MALTRGVFDLVLMDLQMPVMTGLEATAAIRRSEAASGRRIPIVAMTAHAMKGDLERCLRSGMDGYISKPVHPKDLLQAVECYARQEKLSGVSNQPSAKPVASPQELTAER